MSSAHRLTEAPPKSLDSESESEPIQHASPRDFENELSSSQQLQALDLQVSTTPALSVASLRDAILGYLQEAELIVKERLSQTNQAHPHSAADTGTAGWYQDAAAGESSASWSSSIEDPQAEEGSYSGLNLRKRSQALRRRFSTGTRSILPATFSTSPEALLAHLSAIRADVLASMPTVHLPSLSVPAIPSRPSFTRLASLTNASTEGSLPNMMAGFLTSLPARLSYIHEQLPTPPDLTQMSQAGMNLSKGQALAFTEEHKRRIMQLVHGMLPSEDWAGWEKLGWEDEDEYQARMSLGRAKRSHRKSWSNDGPEGKSFLRELDGDVLGLHHSFVRKRPQRRRTVSEGVVGISDLEDDGEADDDDLEEEVQEEPEYLFPNKTPRAALSRHQSYMVTQEAFEREKQARRRSPSISSNNSRGTDFEGQDSDGDEKDDEETFPIRRGRVHLQPVGPVEAVASMPPIAATGSAVIEGLRKSQNGKKLIEFHDLPPWMQNNEYIITGYRFIPLDAKSGPIPLILSLFGWHNETVNIHSHLIPTLVLLVLVIPYTLLHSPISNPAPLDILTLLAFLLAAASCLISSSSWHLLSGCSRRGLFEWGACVDYVGISWLISCSIHTVYYNGFYCQGRTLFIYSMSTLAAAIAGSIAPFQPFFNKRENKPWRIVFFLGICFTALAPLTHLALQHGASTMFHFAGPILTSCAAYIFGLMFYATHFPESRWPGKFDRVGHSHQIWHLSIVLAICLHYRGCIHIFEHREALSCALPDAGEPMSVYLRGYSKYFLGMDQIGQV